MKSTVSQNGRFPYGNQPDYREFLMPSDLEKAFWEHLEENTGSADPLIVAKYFNPVGAQTWYISEYDPQEEILFGFVTGMPFPEWGTISLREFIELQLPLGMKIERDLYYTPQRFSEAVSAEEKEYS